MGRRRHEITQNGPRAAKPPVFSPRKTRLPNPAALRNGVFQRYPPEAAISRFLFKSGGLPYNLGVTGRRFAGAMLDTVMVPLMP